MDNIERYIFVLTKNEKESVFFVDAKYPMEALKKMIAILSGEEWAKKLTYDWKDYVAKINQRFFEVTGYRLIHFSSIEKEFYSEKPVFWGANECQN